MRTTIFVFQISTNIFSFLIKTLSSIKSKYNTTTNSNISNLLTEKKTRNNKIEKNEDKEEQTMLLELLKPDEKDQNEEKENLNKSDGRCQSDQGMSQG